jgi:GNAT superfamily N-acetyltransferase
VSVECVGGDIAPFEYAIVGMIADVTGVEVRRALPDDARSIARMHCASAVAGYSTIFPASAGKLTSRSLEPGWEQLLHSPDASVWVSCSGDDVVGSVVVSVDDSVPSGLALCRLYVEPQFWGASIGSTLHDVAVDDALANSHARINLWVLERNGRARSMYERRGWCYVPGPLMSNAVPGVFDVLYELDLDRRLAPDDSVSNVR